MAPSAVCLTGPTASGKSAVAMALARELPLEIISVDSALVYRGMDIGTAKPTAADRAAVPHHLIDILDPREAYSAARFVEDARRLIGEIQARGRLPLLVGGTLLYLKALREGLDAMPAADAELRRAIDLEAAVRGWPQMHAELRRIDPVTAARLAPADAQRIQRALEVWRLTGKPLSAWQSGAGGFSSERSDGRSVAWAAGRSGERPGDQPLRLPIVSLEPAARAWLHERIARRFDAMLSAGFVDEVRQLRDRGDLNEALPAVRCVGYRQCWQALDRGEPVEGRTATWQQGAIAATRQLAKRQLTWLRSMPARWVVACDAPDAAKSAIRALRAHAGS